MATAEEYAKWIVDNQDKKGTPEFDTVAQAYKIARGSPQAAPATAPAPEKPQTISDTFKDAVNKLVGGPLFDLGRASNMSTLEKFATGGPLAVGLSAVQKAGDTLNAPIAKAGYEGGGKVAELASKAGASPEVSAALGTGANLAIQAAPAVVTGKIAGTISAPAARQGATALMQSALKPVLADLKKGKAAEAIQTMLDEGVSVTPGGLQKLRTKIDDLNRQIATAIRNSPATIDKNAVYGPVKEALDRFTMQVNPQSDVASIKAAWDNFINHPLVSGDQIPVQLAQELKQGTYSALGKKSYGEIKGSDVEAQKAMARGLKDEIAKAVPEVAPLNAEESKLLNALSVNERRVIMEANKNPMGLSLLAKDPAAWAAFMADRSGAFKSLVARMLYSGQQRIPEAAAGMGTAAYQAAQNQ